MILHLGLYLGRVRAGRRVVVNEDKLESVEDIDLERVVADRRYRRRVIAFLNGEEVAQAGSAVPETANRSPSS